MAASHKSSPEVSSAGREAVRLLQAGKAVEAEEVALCAAEQTRQQYGAGSHQDAVAQSELGTILLNTGQLDRAIDAFTESISGPMPTDQQGLRDRLTYLLNLGQALQMAKRFEEAEQTLHKGVTGRLNFYGREHAGYAFGLEPLAEVTLRLGKNDTALEMIEEVVRNFWRNGHKRVAGAIVIRAEMLKAAGNSKPAFGGLEKLPKETIEEIGKKAIARVARTEDLKISRLVLAELLPLLTERLGEAHPQTIAALITISNVERKLEKEGNPEIRQGAIQRAIAVFDAQNREAEALQAVLSLALAQSDAGADEQAALTYKQALNRVEKLNDPREKSQVLRNYGLLLSEMKRDAEAEQRLREAVSEAERSGDTEMTARSLIALGIFRQHRTYLDEAKKLLSRALPMLDPAHPDSISCRSHLQAIETKGSCGCGDMTVALVEAFREFVMSRMPAGMLNKLDVTVTDGKFNVGVHVSRQPSQQELQHLNRVMQNASEEFQRRIGTRGEVARASSPCQDTPKR